MEGDNAIIIAAERGRIKIIQHLYENYRISLFAKDNERTTAYELAHKHKYKEVTDYLATISKENLFNRQGLISARFKLRTKFT